jgi:chromosomal replication initiation ATPase DnaA
MEIKATLQKPYTDQERCDFIVKNNHQQGYEIQETGEALLAIQPDPYIPTDEEQRQARANAYAIEVDPLMSEYNRKKTFNLFEEGEEEELMKAIQNKVAEIKERYKYSEVKDDII